MSNRNQAEYDRQVKDGHQVRGIDAVTGEIIEGILLGDTTYPGLRVILAADGAHQVIESSLMRMIRVDPS